MACERTSDIYSFFPHLLSCCYYGCCFSLRCPNPSLSPTLAVNWFHILLVITLVANLVDLAIAFANPHSLRFTRLARIVYVMNFNDFTRDQTTQIGQTIRAIVRVAVAIFMMVAVFTVFGFVFFHRNAPDHPEVCPFVCVHVCVVVWWLWYPPPLFVSSPESWSQRLLLSAGCSIALFAHTPSF